MVDKIGRLSNMIAGAINKDATNNSGSARTHSGTELFNVAKELVLREFKTGDLSKNNKNTAGIDAIAAAIAREAIKNLYG